MTDLTSEQWQVLERMAAGDVLIMVAGLNYEYRDGTPADWMAVRNLSVRGLISVTNASGRYGHIINDFGRTLVQARRTPATPATDAPRPVRVEPERVGYEPSNWPDVPGLRKNQERRRR